MAFEIDLSGKRALVTGAASGIGHQVAIQLADAGAKVIASDRDPVDVAGLESITADLTIGEQRRNLVERTGPIDLLVNAAGVSITRRLYETAEDDWDRTFEINAKVPFFLMQQVSASMPDGGAIVNFASIAGKIASNVDGVPYNASKAAVIAMTRTFAFALASRRIRVNAICPGVTDTPMLSGIFDEQSRLSGESADSLVDKYLTRVPLGRLGKPDEIARSVIFLLSGAASYITGQAINVCGGLVMW